MAAALALTRRGHSVTILEAFDEPRPVGSGLLLQPSGLAALRALSLETEARDLGAPVTRLEGQDLAGRRLMAMAYDAWRPGASGVGIHRASLFGILHRAVLAAGIEIRTGARIQSFDRFNDPVLHDEAGSAHGPYDLVVVADGSASTLRARVRPRARAPLYPWGAVWANATDPDGRFAGTLSQRYEAASMMTGILPIGTGPDGARNQVSVFWSTPRVEIEALLASDITPWRDRLIRIWPQAEPIFSQFTSWNQFAPATYRDVSVGNWSRGAFVLIGDAAHGTSPQLGQGANLGLIDAVELAQKVDQPRKLFGYQLARRLQTAPYQLASRALTPLFQSKGWIGPLIRAWLFAPLAQAPGLRRIAALFLTGVFRFGPTPKTLKP
jgi:2-polyprenyl-6-methoxyphenol hydroxylase-like FAD-dependent oxidoreductase